jgi:hypothetical protein
MWMLLIPDRPNDWLIAATSFVAAASVRRLIHNNAETRAIPSSR